MLDREISLRLSLLRFPLIVGVVFVHAYSNTMGFADGQIGLTNNSFFVADFVQNFVSQVLARVGSPLFFLISGYLFFARSDWSKEGYLLKLKSRKKTLLIPFLFWNITVLVGIALAQAMPATQVFFSGNSLPIALYDGYDYLNAIFGYNGSPIVYQLWFVRDLMIMVLLAPLINILNKYTPLPFLGIILFSWLVSGWSVSLLFFSVGAYLGSRNKNLFCLDGFGVKIVSLYLVIAIIDALTINQTYNPFLHRVGIIFGILTALFSTSLILQNEKLKLLLIKLSAASFFVYAIHEPLLTIVKKILYKVIVPNSSIAILALYFSIPIMIIIFAVATYGWLANFAPKFTSLITGGR